MLSRVADALFWMSRYLERAEQIAGLLDVCFHLELDLNGVTAGPHELHWTSLASILQQHPRAVRGGSPQAGLSHWLMFDTDNPGSILSCVGRARLNARSIRGTINSEMWRELNKLYWKLRDPEFTARAAESPYEFLQAVETGGQAFQGVCDATLNHDEGWQFIQLGKYLERADRTLRILDIKFHLLQELTDPADLPLSNLHWGGVLRSCRAYEAYHRLFVGRVEPMRVVEFLLLHADFPRSVRFCLEASLRAVEVIRGASSASGLSKAERLLNRILSDLRYGEMDQLLGNDLHGFLTALMDRCARVSHGVQEQYALS